MIHLISKATKEPYEVSPEELAQKFIQSSEYDAYIHLEYNELLAAVIDFIQSPGGLNSKLGYNELDIDSMDFKEFEKIVRSEINERSFL